MAEGDSPLYLKDRGWMYVRGGWWCRACSSLARASVLATQALRAASEERL